MKAVIKVLSDVQGCLIFG